MFSHREVRVALRPGAPVCKVLLGSSFRMIYQAIARLYLGEVGLVNPKPPLDQCTAGKSIVPVIRSPGISTASLALRAESDSESRTPFPATLTFSPRSFRGRDAYMITLPCVCFLLHGRS